MSTTQAPGRPTATQRPTPPSKARRTIVMVVTATAIVASATLIEARWSRLPDLPSEFSRYLGRMFQGLTVNPITNEVVGGYWTNAFDLMLESLHMAWLGTIIGAMLSLPMGFLAARNVSPRPVVAVTRMILNGIRAIPELVWAIIIMIPIFGLGPMAGTMALGINSIGTLGKLSSEVIEGIDPGPVEAARAAGARQTQILRWGALPQALPEIASFWLYRFEINIRAGAILGVVGAGGIGSLLSSVISRRLWERAGIMLLVVILVTIAIDLISARVRARIIAGPEGETEDREVESSLAAGAHA
jgi:phosphonate transport system permease protein